MMEPLNRPETKEDQEGYWCGTTEIEQNVKDKIDDQGRGAYGIVDDKLPAVIEKFNKLRQIK